MKPGFKTTEFWLTLITQVLGMLQLFGVIKPEEAVGMQQGAGQIVGGLMTVLPAVGYAVSRGRAKQKRPGAGATALLVLALLLPALLLVTPAPAASASRRSKALRNPSHFPSGKRLVIAEGKSDAEPLAVAIFLASHPEEHVQ